MQQRIYTYCRFQRMRPDRRVTISADISPPTSATQLLHRGLPLPYHYPRLLLQWASATTTSSTVKIGHTAASAIPAGLRHWAVQHVRTLAVRSPTDTAATTTLTTARTSLPVDSATAAGILTFSRVLAPVCRLALGSLTFVEGRLHVVCC